MNYWKRSKGWILVWSATLLVSGLIIFKGYLSSSSISIQERATKLPSQTTQAVSEGNQTQTIQRTTVDTQADVSAGSVKAQEPSEGLRLVHEPTDMGEKNWSIKDFPSPVQGKILRDVGSYYSETLESYIFHAGVDYAEPEGTVIRATHGGKVVSIGLDPILGQQVTLDCGEGWLVTYGGLDNLRVHVGEIVVNQGALGQVGFFPGAEGQNDRTQLHYEVWHDNEVQRP
ncbi:M23 family metallopeptidase [Desulfosporosinus sp. OT]|uniref:murein hydrolase activator EnvC family protein n=1 Tax=Desulfosporosinus sp. OT TaxID=913865 RepID=UPI000223AA94|nr:M23 family metallopeptidase [Desulfosporosinus sp. OT]EGW38898.1 peptidase M23 family protein [Desulfosporosinus sp. OT]